MKRILFFVLGLLAAVFLWPYLVAFINDAIVYLVLGLRDG